MMNRKPEVQLNPFIPYHFLHEQEPDSAGVVQEVNTIFLASKTCAFSCIFCDLWKSTLEQSPPKGAFLHQMDYALKRLPDAQVVKLYNNGNFFDVKTLSPDDYPDICRRLNRYERVIVENHPLVCGPICLKFQQQLAGQLEVAMGLETIHPGVLPRLGKQFNKADFCRAADFLLSHHIDVRVFVLLNPPYLTEPRESVYWTLESIRFAFAQGATCCAVIPTRATTAEMQRLAQQGDYQIPTLDMLEDVVEKALQDGYRRVFADTWDIAFMARCPHCFEARKQRLERMNLTQRLEARIHCAYCQTHA